MIKKNCKLRHMKILLEIQSLLPIEKGVKNNHGLTTSMKKCLHTIIFDISIHRDDTSNNLHSKTLFKSFRLNFVRLTASC